MLQLSGLSITYPGNVHALRDVSLTVPRGLFGLLGPNGAGKSTLMRTLATLQSPDRGHITFDGISIHDDVMGHRRRLGYLPQDFGVYPGVSAVDLLDHLAVLKGLTDRHTRREQIDALLVQVNLWEERRRAVSGYSGGMRQRFGIAQALLGDPRLVIVDEPTAGLDPAERSRFYNLLSAIGDNVVVLLSTHIVEDVRQLCPQMAIMSRGTVVATGAPDELVRALDGQIWSTAVARSEEERWTRSHQVLSTQFHAGQLRLRIRAEAAPTPGSRAVPSELEDVYFNVLATDSSRLDA
jgi:ABC-2 type transport system ATP-binding protein